MQLGRQQSKIAITSAADNPAADNPAAYSPVAAATCAGLRVNLRWTFC